MTYDIEGAIKEYFGVIDSHSREQLFWIAKLTQAIEETQKAFGGCMKCYGKGYSTQMVQEIGAEDFGNDGYVKDPEMVINPCSCDRGKQIKDILSIARKVE